MTAFAAFRLKADSDIILLSKFPQFLEKFVAVHVFFIGFFVRMSRQKCPNLKGADDGDYQNVKLLSAEAAKNLVFLELI
jgi:hypothetical protein